MKRLLRALAMLLATGAPALAQDSPLAITHVTVIDVENGRRLPDQTVVIESGRIRAVGVASGVTVPARATRVDGQGKFLIPGLWDMHVHVFSQNTNPGTDSHAASFPLLIANGVTGVREMWTDQDDLRILASWRRDAAAGRLLMPLVVPTSTPLDGPNPSTTGRAASLKPATPEAGRRFVDSLVAGGARTIKILVPPRDVYFAVIDEARKLGVPIVGHVSVGVHAIEASRAGLRSIEHMQTIPEGCSSAEAMLDSVMEGGRNPNLRQQTLVSTFDPVKCDALFRAFVTNQTWQTPTEALNNRQLLAGQTPVMSDPHFRYAAIEDTIRWRRNTVRAQAADSVTLRNRREMNGLRLRLIGRMYRAGVPMLIGTDLGNPFMIAGFSVHDEMALHAEAGATPAQVLRAATFEPARYLNATDSLGTVAVGKRADLVLLDADPLADIANAARIRGVIVAGRHLDRPALDSLLEMAARIAPTVWGK
jgi:imidazolonepropionase-like amidohydrolase